MKMLPMMFMVGLFSAVVWVVLVSFDIASHPAKPVAESVKVVPAPAQEARIKKLEAQVKTLEDWAQRRGMKY